MPAKKKKTPTPRPKRAKAAEKKPQQRLDADPEWDALEERYSQIGSEMRNLAKLLHVGDGGGEEL